jgi:hypothetical protein
MSGVPYRLIAAYSILNLIQIIAMIIYWRRKRARELAHSSAQGRETS